MLVTQAINAMGGVLKSHVQDDQQIRNFVIDSRQAEKGSCFVAFKGGSTDGNLHAKAAAQSGAVLTVLTDEEAYSQVSGSKVLVKDPLGALKDIGTYNLSSYKGVKIAVTGSVGKTTTKELISEVLKTRKRVYTAYGNYNNELGVALCAANLKMGTSYAVFEMGTNSKGEISALSHYIKPDICVVTGIGHAHIGRFSGIEGLAEEKLSIVDGMKKRGVLYISDSCRRFVNSTVLEKADVRYFGSDMASHVILADLNRTASGDFYFTAVARNTPYCFKLNHIYSHFVQNSLPAIAIGMAAGLSYTDVMKGIRNFQPKDGRGKIKELNGIKLIDDTYNAGFESVVSAMRNLAEIPSEKKTAFIGEMGEIEGYEEMLYLKLIKLASELKDVDFVFVGKGFSKFDRSKNIKVVPSREEAFMLVSDIGDGTVLFKASRSQKFEELVKHLEKEKMKSAV
jgi:UDP-N-acetylmuramoyl-tripeptide--D-alanyl-D-alanine ligase